jgi:hypothetical protein
VYEEWILDWRRRGVKWRVRVLDWRRKRVKTEE